MCREDKDGSLDAIIRALGAAPGVSATGPDTLSNSFLGVPVEICIATRSLDKTISAMVSLGIGPWGLYRFDEETVADRRSYGEPDPYILNVAFARNGAVIWEVMQPVEGAPALQKPLKHAEQVLHHVAFDGAAGTMEQRRAELDRRGAVPALSGLWLGEVDFYFFETPGLDGIVLESYVFPEDFRPEPEAWYPSPPPDRDTSG